MNRFGLLLTGLAGFTTFSTGTDVEAHDSSARFQVICAYQRRCSRCHELQPPAKYSDGAWERAVHAMETRAHLTRNETEAILAYLKLSK